MGDEEQAVYEQYPPFKDIRGVIIFIFIIFHFFNSYLSKHQ